MYDVKHNDANLEGNRDGTDNNLSWNHGVEGPTDDADVQEARLRSIRNLLGTLLTSTGVPMLNAGDEFGRSQDGNNNAFCQDNETSWFDWDLAPWQQDLLETTRHLVRLRATLPVLRQRAFPSGRQIDDDGSTDIAWFTASGQPMTDAVWTDPSVRTLAMYLDGAELGERSVLVARARRGQPGAGDPAGCRPGSAPTSCCGTAPGSDRSARPWSTRRPVRSTWPPRRCGSTAPSSSADPRDSAAGSVGLVVELAEHPLQQVLHRGDPDDARRRRRRRAPAAPGRRASGRSPRPPTRGGRARS